MNNFKIIDFKKGSDFYYIKIEAEVIDESTLFIGNYVSKSEYLYSYHWQDKNDNLIIRWDNCPHHKHLPTFPHHKHIPEIIESNEIMLEDILKVMEKKTQRKLIIV
ncbi:MAG: DUF6516 family protein [Promethearchaeota archaeon]